MIFANDSKVITQMLRPAPRENDQSRCIDLANIDLVNIDLANIRAGFSGSPRAKHLGDPFFVV
jgi:hypothetical protein